MTNRYEGTMNTGVLAVPLHHLLLYTHFVAFSVFSVPLW